MFSVNFDERILLNNENEEMWFSWAINKNYSQTKNYIILGREVRLPVTDISPVVEVLSNVSCNHDCKFCVEDATLRQSKHYLTIDEHCELLHRFLSDCNAQGLYPSVTITGGEPLLTKERTLRLLETVKAHKIKNFGLNTNAVYLLNDVKYEEVFNRYFDDETVPFHINISRHHYDDEINQMLFGRGKAITSEQLSNLNKLYCGRLSLQLVMCNDYLGNFVELQKFLYHFTDCGFRNFNIRAVSRLSETVGNRNEKIDFCNQNQVDMMGILDEVAKDNRFEFVRQSIGNNSLHEFYSYRNSRLKFIFTNNDYFRKFDEQNVEKGNNSLASILIMLPDGRFFRNWNYDISQI